MLAPMPETAPGDEHLEFTLRELRAGDAVFQRYRLAGVLGRGGMGVVWRARDEELSRDIALKFIPEQLVHDPEAIADLKRETSRCLELTHPNIVRIYDLAYDPQRVAISMELVDGGSLSLLKVSQAARCLEVERVAPLDPAAPRGAGVRARERPHHPSRPEAGQSHDELRRAG